MNISCIDHQQPNFVMLRRDYLQITGGSHVAAKLLSLFEHWTNWKHSKGYKHAEWISLSVREIVEQLMGEHGRDAIISALKYLKDRLRFIDRQGNPRNGQDRTWQYKLETEKIQEALKTVNQGIVEKSISHVEKPININRESSEIKKTTKQPVVVKKSVRRQEEDKKEAVQLVESELDRPEDSNSEPEIDSEDLNSATRQSEILAEVADAGFSLNPQLRTTVLSAAVQVVQEAISAVKEYLATGKPVQKTREALLVSAIQKQWKPNEVQVSQQLLDLIKLVEAEQCGRRVFTQMLPDGIHVRHNDTWMPWEKWRDEMLTIHTSFP